MSCVTVVCYMSCVNCRASPVTCHLSPVTIADSTETDPNPANSPNMHSRLVRKDALPPPLLPFNQTPPVHQELRFPRGDISATETAAYRLNRRIGQFSENM